ncbi:MAG: hypothetical protein ACT4OZ_05320 [Gemmatimonadota bacterium]
MRAIRVTRDKLATASIAGAILAHDIRDADGRILLGKGSTLVGDDAEKLSATTWKELHLIQPDADDVGEDECGRRLAAAVCGPGLERGQVTAGSWPLVSTVRGIVRVDVHALDALNAVEGLCVYTLYDGQVVDTKETVGRAKVIPFVLPRAELARGEAAAAGSTAVVSVQPFRPLKVGAVVQETIGDRAASRFRAAFSEKLQWLGAREIDPLFVPANVEGLRAGLVAMQTSGASVIAVAGARAMDPLDPVFEAVSVLGGRMVRHGVPAHPGSLCWVADLVTCAIVGMPSCGLFSRATVFDLLLPRLLLGESLAASHLSRLGHGGFLTSDMAYRFPPYRRSAARGAVES